jgi:hypothetical protein
MAVFNEGGDALLNTCAVLVRSDEQRRSVLDLVDWLLGYTAQEIIEHFGKDWNPATPLVTRRDNLEVEERGEMYLVSPANFSAFRLTLHRFCAKAL